MAELFDLFITFVIIGSVSFGGGYAMIPLIEHEVALKGWMSVQELTDVIAVAGMSPGPIATNSAIFVGYKTAALPGAIVSTLGMITPSLIFVILIASFFYKINQNLMVKSAFYGLRPIITGLIIYAAISFGISNGMTASFSPHVISMVVITAVSLFVMLRFRVHPVYVILMSGLVGVALYS